MPTGIYDNSKRRGMFVKGQNCGEKHPGWKGGKTIGSNGYIFIYKPDHPFAQKIGYVSEHRLVMEKKLGRFLKPFETVHHINGDKQDNRIENLIMFSSNIKHLSFHKLNGDKIGFQNGHKPFTKNYHFKKGHPKPKNAYVFPKGHPSYHHSKLKTNQPLYS